MYVVYLCLHYIHVHACLALYIMYICFIVIGILLNILHGLLCVCYYNYTKHHCDCPSGMLEECNTEDLLSVVTSSSPRLERSCSSHFLVVPSSLRTEENVESLSWTGRHCRRASRALQYRQDMLHAHTHTHTHTHTHIKSNNCISLAAQYLLEVQ